LTSHPSTLWFFLLLDQLVTGTTRAPETDLGLPMGPKTGTGALMLVGMETYKGRLKTTQLC
jgi:hypothetical protein